MKSKQKQRLAAKKAQRRPPTTAVRMASMQREIDRNSTDLIAMQFLAVALFHQSRNKTAVRNRVLELSSKLFLEARKLMREADAVRMAASCSDVLECLGAKAAQAQRAAPS